MHNIERYIIAIIIISILGCQNPLKEAPWREIFDGVSANGWEIRDGDAEMVVRDGLLTARQIDSLHFAYLIFEEQLDNFILECEVKLTGTLNSGILIRGISNPDLNDGKIHGFQMEIDQSERQWTGGIYEEWGRKWLTPLKGMGDGEAAAFGAYKHSDWNHYRIEAIADTFKIWVNDIPTTHLIDDKTAEGLLGFQIHLIEPGTKSGMLMIRDVRLITENPEEYSREISLPVKDVPGG